MSSMKDIAIGISVPNHQMGLQNKKTPYLILIEDLSGKSRVVKKFISLDIPTLLGGFIQTKGFFSEETEEDLSKNIWEIVSLFSTTGKDSIIEIFFPHSKIISMRSLIFKAK